MDRQKVPPHICPRVTADRALRWPPKTDDPAGDPRAVLTPLGALNQDRSVWPRGDYDEEALVRYRDCLDQLPPVRVDRASGVLLDGFHRVKVWEGSSAAPWCPCSWQTAPRSNSWP